jgi:hypothetical protein
MPSPFPPGSLPRAKPAPSGWGLLFSKRGLAALAVVLGLVADAVSTKYPAVTGILGTGKAIADQVQQWVE